VSELLVTVFVPLLTELVAQLPTGMEGLHRVGILHRDISSENVMVDVKKQGMWVILNDFDLAGRVKEEGARARHRTGTLPFMAIELLKKADATHCLRHDLESLFYVAVWWAVTATHGQADRDAATSRRRSLAYWNQGTPRAISLVKQEFLTLPWKDSGIELSPGFEGMIRTLLKLKKLFRDAEQSKTNRKTDLENFAYGIGVELHREHADTETADDISPETFRLALTS